MENLSIKIHPETSSRKIASLKIHQVKIVGCKLHPVFMCVTFPTPQIDTTRQSLSEFGVKIALIKFSKVFEEILTEFSSSLLVEKMKMFPLGIFLPSQYFFPSYEKIKFLWQRIFFFAFPPPMDDKKLISNLFSFCL